jgi:hypothetical protein
MPYWEANSWSATQKFPSDYGIPISLPSSEDLATSPILCQINLVHKLFRKNFYISVPPISRSSKMSFSLMCIPLKSSIYFYYSVRANASTLLIFLHLIILIIQWIAQIRNFLFTTFRLSSSFTSYLLEPNIPLGTPFQTAPIYAPS